LIEEGEFYYLLAGLIEAVPYISNIAGTYGAFLKHWDKRTAKPLELVKLEIDDNREQNICFNMDANKLIKEIRGDILYIDPPYNQRQYGPNYHLLETISRYDCPDIYGLTGMRKYEDIKSDYCVKNKVIQAFSDLIENAKFKNIVVSYSTEGIMTEDEVVRVLTECGGLKSTLKIKHIPYRRYKHMAGAVEHNLRELLFFIKKGNK
jgi:adenine-specific DNA-methyltransferase